MSSTVRFENDAGEQYIEADYRATQVDMLSAKNALMWLITETPNGSLKDNPAAIAALPDAVMVLARYF